MRHLLAAHTSDQAQLESRQNMITGETAMDEYVHPAVLEKSDSATKGWGQDGDDIGKLNGRKGSVSL